MAYDLTGHVTSSWLDQYGVLIETGYSARLFGYVNHDRGLVRFETFLQSENFYWKHAQLGFSVYLELNDIARVGLANGILNIVKDHDCVQATFAIPLRGEPRLWTFWQWLPANGPEGTSHRFSQLSFSMKFPAWRELLLPQIRQAERGVSQTQREQYTFGHALDLVERSRRYCPDKSRSRKRERDSPRSRPSRRERPRDSPRSRPPRRERQREARRRKRNCPLVPCVCRRH
jgi:hypothetical protein